MSKALVNAIGYLVTRILLAAFIYWLGGTDWLVGTDLATWTRDHWNASDESQLWARATAALGLIAVGWIVLGLYVFARALAGDKIIGKGPHRREFVVVKSLISIAVAIPALYWFWPADWPTNWSPGWNPDEQGLSTIQFVFFTFAGIGITLSTLNLIFAGRSAGAEGDGGWFDWVISADGSADGGGDGGD